MAQNEWNVTVEPWPTPIAALTFTTGTSTSSLGSSTSLSKISSVASSGSAVFDKNSRSCPNVIGSVFGIDAGYDEGGR